MCNEYNGWPNYPTWAVSVWNYIDEDFACQLVNESDDVYEVAKGLEEEFDRYIEDMYPQLTEASLISDLFSFATGKIDWYRHAEHCWDEYREEPEEEEGDEIEEEE